jgi:opacity protein-like surface antigen
MLKRLVLVVILLYPSVSNAGENILVPMIGFSSWSDNSGHIARGNTINFEDNQDLTFGFKYLYLFDSGFALGGNFYLYGKDVLTTSQASDSGVLHVHAVAEYFFSPKSSVSPFVGAGIGFTVIGFDGGTLDNDGTGGGSYELNGGVLFRISERVGFQVEYKYVDFDMDEDIDGFTTNIDSSSQSLLFGVSIHI